MKLCNGEKFFKCRSEDRCISSSLKCDEVADCPDASDESDTMCHPDHDVKVERRPCDSEKEFECEGKICIPKKLVCDGTSHCFDGRDEDPIMCADLKLKNNVSRIFEDFLWQRLEKKRFIFRKLVADFFARTANACHVSIGSVTVRKIAQMGVTKNIVHLIVSYQKEVSCVRVKTNVCRSQKFAMANLTAQTRVMKETHVMMLMLARN